MALIYHALSKLSLVTILLVRSPLVSSNADIYSDNGGTTE